MSHSRPSVSGLFSSISLTECINSLSDQFAKANANLENKQDLATLKTEQLYTAKIVKEHFQENLFLTINQALIDSIEKLYTHALSLKKAILDIKDKGVVVKESQLSIVNTLAKLTTNIIDLFSSEFGHIYQPPKLVINASGK